MHNIYRFLIALIRKLGTTVCPILSWGSHSNVARLLNRLLSFILEASRPLPSKSRATDTGDPSPAILLPSDAASVELFTVELSPREIEEGLSVPAVDQHSTEKASPMDSSPRAMEDNDDESGLPLPKRDSSHKRTYFSPIHPWQSQRYSRKFIMCVCQVANIRHYQYDRAGQIKGEYSGGDSAHHHEV